MTKFVTLRGVILFVCGILVGGFWFSRWGQHVFSTRAASDQAGSKNLAADIATMQTDITHLKQVVPSQSHSMTDVGYQFANLWFAGKQKNWPLATFFLNEARQHIRWTIRIRPIRKNLAGEDVDLKGIFDSIDSSVMVRLQKAIDNKDSEEFAAAYKDTLVQCYTCHKSSDKPFLRPMVPTSPPQTIINFDPNAKWPE